MKGYFIVTRNLVNRAANSSYLFSEFEIRDMLEEALAMAEVDKMELVSTFRTEDNILFMIFRNK